MSHVGTCFSWKLYKNRAAWQEKGSYSIAKHLFQSEPPSQLLSRVLFVSITLHSICNKFIVNILIQFELNLNEFLSFTFWNFHEKAAVEGAGGKGFKILNFASVCWAANKQLGLCTEHNWGWIWQSGRVIHVYFAAPMGHGLSLSCPAPRSGFMRGKTNPKPDY